MISLLVVQKLLRTLFLLGFVRHGTNYLSASGNLTPYQSFTRNCLIIIMISSVPIFIGRNWLIIIFMITSVPIGGLRARTIPWFFGHFWKCSHAKIQLLLNTFKKGWKIKGSFLLWAFQFFLSYLSYFYQEFGGFFCKFDFFNVINLEFVLK